MRSDHRLVPHQQRRVLGKAGVIERGLHLLKVREKPNARSAWQTWDMTAPSHREMKGSARLVDRALRVVEDATHSLRQRLLARELGHSLPLEHWTPTATDEPGLSAGDLRRHAAEVRHNQQG